MKRETDFSEQLRCLLAVSEQNADDTAAMRTELRMLISAMERNVALFRQEQDEASRSSLKLQSEKLAKRAVYLSKTLRRSESRLIEEALALLRARGRKIST